MKPAAWITDDPQLAKACEVSRHRITSVNKPMTYLVHIVPVSAIPEETPGVIEKLAGKLASANGDSRADFLLRVAAIPEDSETIARYLHRARSHGTDRTKSMTVTWAPVLNDAVAHAQKILADAENGIKVSGENKMPGAQIEKVSATPQRRSAVVAATRTSGLPRRERRQIF